MASQRSDRPTFLIVAGPNGSGKSTAYETANSEFEGRTFWIVNPDRLTARLQANEGFGLGDANLKAVIRLEAWLSASLDVHSTIGVETVLSTDKYRKLVEQAKALGYELWMIYVLLDDPELNIARVASRVRKGGHAVAEADIRKRYHRSLAQLPWFLNRADRAWLYNNSGASLQLVGRKQGDVVTLDPTAPKVLIEALSPSG